MIRHVTLVQLKPDADLAVVAEVQDGFRAMNCAGTVSYTLGDDAGLRDGNWSFGIVADLEDEQAFRGYDADAEHNRLRAVLAPHVAQIARVQFVI